MPIVRNYAREYGSDQWFRNSIRHIWHKLTEEEIGSVEERRDVFFLAIRKKHGLGRAQAELVLSDLRHRLADAA
jgi:hypothetical protein